MRALSIITALAVVVLIGLTLAPETLVPGVGAYHYQLTIAALAVSAVLLILTLAVTGRETKPTRPIAEAVKPPPAAIVPNRAEAEIVTFIGMMQDKGRLVDFLMDDITAYSDAQVGAAARAVHQGCRATLLEHFKITPVRDETEGSKVTVPEGFRADEYRLVGKIAGEAPFSGTLVHRGWRTATVKLPRVSRTDADRLPAIAPAEIELK